MTRPVPLLTFDQEITLAKKLERGRQAPKELEAINTDAEDASRLKSLVKQDEQARHQLIKANPVFSFGSAQAALPKSMM